MHKRILLIGCGRWGANIIRDLLALQCDVSVLDPDEERRAFALRAGARTDVPDVVDGVIIATPATSHAQSMRDALRFGVPLFVEKPFTTSSVDAREFLGERIFVMDKWRYHAGVEELRRIAQTRELGRVIALSSIRTQSADTQTDVDAIWTLAPHDLAIAHEILGTMPIAIGAAGERCSGGRVGLTARLRAGDVAVTIDVSACRAKRERNVILECENGTATLDAAAGGEPPLFRELAAFLGYLDGGEPPRGRVHDAVAIVETIEHLRALAGFSS
ncbi:MAG TPA: Gfo/Idh/MocA family oxidoreductase [Thermoanaerobaculia bacterium]|nr:Gfo/Idh/MocA family oxidoreductase [Thermoanaerobaculia bacterium]